MINDSCKWSFHLRRKDRADILIAEIPRDRGDIWEFDTNIEGFHISVRLKKEKLFTAYRVCGTSETSEKGHFVLRQEYENGIPWNFDGAQTREEIFRQSPHDVDAWISEEIAKQAVPLIAVQDANLQISGALSSSPAFYDNYTTQGFFPRLKRLELSSGDSGVAPGGKPEGSLLEKEYNLSGGQKLSRGKIETRDHEMSLKKPHVMDGLFFEIDLMKGQIQDQRNFFRQQVNRRIAVHYCGSQGNSLFGDLSAATAYMNLRKNDSGDSDFWVVPAVEYSNVQYGRDAFWISMMLTPEMDASCLANDLVKADTYSEYCLFDVIWAYRAFIRGQEIEKKNLKRCLDVIRDKVRDSWFYAYDEKDGRQDFQFWGDIMAFEKDDVVTYNQGLLAAALAMAEEMGMDLPEQMDPVKAAENYRSLFNRELGFFPISRQKNELLTVDALVGDLLFQTYLNESLLSREQVADHYDKMIHRSKTPWGFKTVCMADGSFLPHELYNAGEYIAQINREENMPDGTYYRGGSYLLYDGLMLLDACLHKIPGAEKELVERIRMEFEIGGTTYECLNTVTGEPWKPNMGWNGALYALLKKFTTEGKINKTVLDELN